MIGMARRSSKVLEVDLKIIDAFIFTCRLFSFGVKYSRSTHTLYSKDLMES